MYKTHFFKKNKSKKNIYCSEVLRRNTIVAKFPIFINNCNNYKIIKIIHTMYKSYLNLYYWTDVRLLRVFIPFSFFIWAMFVSFRPIFELRIKTVVKKAGTKKFKYRSYVSRSRSISKTIVKRWIRSYYISVLLKFSWKKILFIYISLINNRAETPIFLNYMNASQKSIFLPYLWRRGKRKKKKKRILYWW